MYGMVNRAFEDYFREHHGEATWIALKAAAGVEAEEFLSMTVYPDELSVAIVVKGAEHLGITPAEMLERLGVFWITFAERNGYGDILRLTGDSMLEFVQNLDELHARIAMSFPELKPPSFWATDAGVGALTVHYKSQRDGLAPFVVGLLHGVARMFGVEARITHTSVRAAGAEHDQFRVELPVPA